MHPSKGGALAPLAPAHVRWLAASIAAAQLPHLVHLPWWLGAAGLGAVALRLWGERRRVPPPSPWLLFLGGLAAALAIRIHFGYLAGREPSVAFLYVLVGLKLLEARQVRDATSLLCLAAFLTLTQFFYGQGVLAALASAPALMVICASLLVVRETDEPVAWRDGLRFAGRFLVHGLPLAFVFFVLFPRAAGPLWGLPSDSIGSTGLSDSMTPGSISELSLSDDVAFRVSFDGAVPAPRDLYWRGPVLSVFDGRTWRSRPTGDIVSAAVPAGMEPVAYTVSLEPNNERYYLALDMPVGSPPPGAKYTRQMELMTTRPVNQPVTYRQQSILRPRLVQPEPLASVDEQLPVAGNLRARAWAADLRARFADPARLAGAVLQRFREGGFGYTLEVSPAQSDQIDDFLFETKQGFCEYYASAFVFVLRAAGIPARVVTGYQGGEANEIGDLPYLIVRQSDAHAWAEAWISGQWMRFDPTAEVAPSRIEGGLGQAMRGNPLLPFLARLDRPWLRYLGLRIDGLNYGWQRWIVGYNAERQRSILGDAGLGDAQPRTLVFALTAAASLCAGAAAAFLLLRRARLDPALAAWERLCARLAKAGLPRRAHEGALAYAERAARRWPPEAARLRDYAQAYCAWRYGTPDRAAGAARAMARLWAQLPSSRALRDAR